MGKRRKKWEQQEIDFLKKNYKTLYAKDIGKKLNRSMASIQAKAFKLKIEGNKKGKNKDKIIKFNSIYWKGKSRKGRKVTWGDKISKGNLGKLLGEKNPMWLGGIAYKPYGSGFSNSLKRTIRTRDKFKCQECFIPQKKLKYKLPIHHIDYNKKNNSPDNLISLCRTCHAKTGYKRKDWKNYFMEKLSNAN